MPPIGRPGWIAAAALGNPDARAGQLLPGGIEPLNVSLKHSGGLAVISDPLAIRRKRRAPVPARGGDQLALLVALGANMRRARKFSSYFEAQNERLAGVKSCQNIQ